MAHAVRRKNAKKRYVKKMALIGENVVNTASGMDSFSAGVGSGVGSGSRGGPASVSGDSEVPENRETRKERVSRLKDEVEVKLEVGEHSKYFQRAIDSTNTTERFNHQMSEMNLEADLSEAKEYRILKVEDAIMKRRWENKTANVKQTEDLIKYKSKVVAENAERVCVGDNVPVIRWRSNFYSNCLAAIIGWIAFITFLYGSGLGLVWMVSSNLAMFLSGMLVPFFILIACSVLARTRLAGVDWIVRTDDRVYGINMSADFRPESMSAVDIKYWNPTIRQHSRTLYVVIWNTKILRLWTWYGFHSTELLHHLSANNLQFVHADEEIAKKKRALMVENFHSLNLPRDCLHRFGNIGRATAFLSYGMWCSDRQATYQMDF